MITEDYVSFETAKLLKEKGFNERLLTFYITDESKKEGCFQIMAFTDDKIDNNHSDLCYLAPTLQMTMKWLREMYDIYIDISIYVITKNIVKYNINVYYKKKENDSMYLGIHLTKECSKYEEAVEAAIKYCLENLI